MKAKGTFMAAACLFFLLPLILTAGMATGGQTNSRIAFHLFDTSVRPEVAGALGAASETIPGLKGIGDPVDMDAALIAGANYLKHAQADVTEDNAGNGNPDADPEDGGWDWRLTSPTFVHSASSSPTNIYGATAQGLYRSYLETADASYLTAMQDAANYMIGNASIRSAADLVFLMLFQDLPGVTPDVYSDAAKAKFDARITTYGSATALAEYIRDTRQGQGYENGIIPWDISGWVVAAQMLEDRYPSDAYDYAQAADDMAEVMYQDSYQQNPGYFDLTTDKNNGWDPTYSNYDYYWYTLGITGMLDAFYSADVHTDKIADLLTILLDCQYPGGAFSYCYGANTDDEDWQSTAYSVMSLGRVDQATYQTEINHACYWLGATQDAGSGGWVYSTGNHYPEVGGECAAALYFGQEPTEVWVDDDYTEGGYNDGHLWAYDAFDNIQDGINAVAENGTVNVAAGTYQQSLGGWRDLELFKSLNLIGAGSGQTMVELSNKQHGMEIRGTNASILVEGMTFTKQATNPYSAQWAVIVEDVASSFSQLTFRDVEVAYASARNLYLGNNTYNSILVEDCNIHHSGVWGMSARGTIQDLTILNSHFDYNGSADPGHGIGFDIDMPITVNSLTVNGGTFSFNQSKGINLVKTNHASFSNITANNNAGSPGGGFGVSLWEWVSGSSDLSFTNSSFCNNSLDGFLFGTESTYMIDDVDIQGCFIKNNGRYGVLFYHNYGGDATNVAITSCDLSGNTSGAIGTSAKTALVNASGNWYGSYDPSAVDASVGAQVDYTPWLHDGTDQSGDPGFQPDLSYLHVDDSSPQTGSAGYVGEALDMVSGSTVELEAGTYVEQVHITEDDLVLLGSGSDNTTIKSPATLSDYFTTGSNKNYPVVFVDGATGVAISDVTIDGDHKGNANYRFTGLGLWNGDASLSDAKILNVMDNPLSGSQHGVGIYSNNDDGGPYSITLDNVVVDDFQKTAVALLGTGLTVDIDDVTTIGEGATGVTAQNGIQIGPGVNGTVDHCVISGMAYTGATWTASGFLNWGNVTATGLQIDHCQTGVYWTDGTGTFTGGSITDPMGDGFYAYNSSAKGTKRPRVYPQPFDELPDGGAKAPMSVTLSNTAIIGDGIADSWGVGAFSTSTDPVNLTVTGCLITNWDYGVFAYDYGGPVNCYVHWNSIFGNSSYGLYNGTATMVDAEFNSWGSVDGPQDLIGSDEARLDQCYDVSTMVNAVAELSGTLGNAVSENADYCPWLGGDAGFDAELYAGCNDPCDDFCVDFKLTGVDVRFFHFEYPLPTCLAKTAVHNTFGSGLVTFQATMFGNVLHIDGNFDPNLTGANVKLGEICFSHDGSCANTIQTLACTAQEVLDGSGNPVEVTPGLAIVNIDNTAPAKDHPTGDILPCYSSPDDPDWTCWNLSFYKGAEEWQCDLLEASIRIYDAPGCNSGDLVFTHDFFSTPITGDFSICYPTDQAEKDAIWATLSTDGTYYVRLTVNDNCCNQADNCDAFTFCKDTYTDNHFTCLDAKPAHNHICVQWDYDADAVEAVSCRILRSPCRAGNYPEYAASDPVPSGYDDPNWYLVYEGTDAYPCAGADWYSDDGTGCDGGGTLFDDDTRDIYWYAGFTQDAAGNWSAANVTLGTGTDRATSYWLGDVTDISGMFGPDGQVFGFTGDVGRLTSAYGTAPASPFWDNTVDYGPETEEHGIGRGVPIPDDVINYKDLKPFSYNYNIVGASGDCSTWPLLHNHPPHNLKVNVQEVAVWLEPVPSSSPHKTLTVALMLKNPDDATHLFHSRISYNTNVLSLAKVRQGEVGITPGHDAFFASPVMDEGVVDVDLAGLGPDAYLIGSGAVAYLDFAVQEGGAPSEVWLKEIVLYDGEGNEIPLMSQSVQIDAVSKSHPTEFALHQNHPNPFNPATAIKFDLPRTCNVKLVVYNVQGRKVATLVDGVVEAGRHEVVWNAEGLSSGVYFYRLAADNFTQMHKMMLLK
jgi:hypothetical protein